ncbi:MAG: hypothetical protein PHC29_01785 [Candidatus Omnitrophica bacterium]|nr:hypothetical protein [Candidatus Omnitrophota bacterium]
MKKFLWIFISTLMFLVAALNFFIYQYRLNDTFNRTRQRLISIASNVVLSIDAQEVLKIPLEQRSEGTPEYLAIYYKLEEIKNKNLPFVKYIYIMTTTVKPGILQYVVDADPVPQIITARCPTSLPGDKYDARQLPEMLEAYNAPTADRKITTDAWGTFISGYAPIRDTTGVTIAILGVDSDGTSIQIMQKSTKTRGIIVLFTGLLFIISFTTLIKYH